MAEDSVSSQQQQQSSQTSFFNIKLSDLGEPEPHLCSAEIGLGWGILCCDAEMI